MRRFEYIHGNQAKFWEVTRRGGLLTQSSGRIGGASKTRTKQLADFMAAEQEFDRLIRDKLRRGYVEVHAASEPDDPADERTLRLVSSAGTLDLKGPATRYLTWRMVEVGVMDKQTPAPDLTRWAHRASRRLRREDVPPTSDPSYPEFRVLYLELSLDDRSAETGQHAVIGAYKLAVGSDWVITAREANWLADASKNRTPRRHKVTTNQEQWLAEWAAFNEKAAGSGGYTVELVGTSRVEPRRVSRPRAVDAAADAYPAPEAAPELPSEVASDGEPEYLDEPESDSYDDGEDNAADA